MARQTSEDDEISRIKKQNKTAATPATETVEERQPATTPAPAHPPPREAPAEREPEEPARRPMPARYALTITRNVKLAEFVSRKSQISTRSNISREMCMLVASTLLRVVTLLDNVHVVG